MADIYRYISYIFLFVQVLYSEYHCAAAHNSVRLSLTVITVLGAASRQTPQLMARAGKPRTATWEYCPGKVSYLTSFWPPR